MDEAYHMHVNNLIQTKMEREALQFQRLGKNYRV